jgi:hypothetical protein
MNEDDRGSTSVKWSVIMSNPARRAILKFILDIGGRFRPVDVRNGIKKQGFDLKPSTFKRHMDILCSGDLLTHEKIPISEYHRYRPCEEFQKRYQRILGSYDKIDNMIYAQKLFKRTKEIHGDPLRKEETGNNLVKLLTPDLFEELSCEQWMEVMKWWVDFHTDS